MNRYKFHQHALETLEKPTERPPAPETMVSMQMEAATAELALKKSQDAATRLDNLLAKLTADYWRRPEIRARRLSLLHTKVERERMIAEASKRVEDRPNDEAAALDLAQILTGLQHRRRALDVLTAAGTRLPNSEAIERQTLDLFDRLHDERLKQDYLKQRLEHQPNRRDLALLRIKSLFQIARGEEAQEQWEKLLEDVPAAEQADRYLEMGRYLRQSQLLTDAAKILAKVLELDSTRLDRSQRIGRTPTGTGQSSANAESAFRSDRRRRPH